MSTVAKDSDTSSLEQYRLLRIPPTGPCRAEAISRLCDRGINDREKEDIKLCYDVAGEIENIMNQQAKSFFQEYKTIRTGSRRQTLPTCEPPSRKRRKVADELSAAEECMESEGSGESPSNRGTTCVTVCQDTSSTSTSSGSLHLTPRGPTSEHSQGAICEESVAAERRRDSGLEHLDQGIEDF